MTEIHQKLCAIYERKDFIFGAGILATIYAFHGIQSQVFCEIILGSIPAAFTYKVILTAEAKRDGLLSLLFFWVLHGIFAAVVHLITPTGSFYFLKYATLGVFFIHALSSNKESLNSFHLSLPEVDRGTRHHLAKTVFAETTECTQMPTKANIDPAKPVINETVMTVSTANDFTDSQQISRNRSIRCATTPAYGLWRPKEDDTDQTTADIWSNVKTYEPPDDNKTLIEDVDGSNRELDPELKETAMTMTPLGPYVAEQCSIDDLHARNVPSGDTTQQDRTCTVPLGHGDIDTRPATLVIFDHRSVGAKSTIIVINTSEEQIIWALKTNALDRLQASPTCGIIPRGETIEIKFAISESCDGIVSGTDRVAIDYAFVPTTVKDFERTLFDRAHRRRHLMRISFDE